MLINSYRFGDADAAAYIAAVQAADGQALETTTAAAITAFIVDCKADGIWTAIKASCILAGARTLAGALVPLVGTAPTNVNFVSGDYNRKTGLVGDRNTKYLNSNRNNSINQDNQSLSVYLSMADSFSAYTSATYIGTGGGTATGATHIGSDSASAIAFFRSRNASTQSVSGAQQATGFRGMSRVLSTSFSYRINEATTTTSVNSETPAPGNIYVFGRNVGDAISLPTAARIAFYSIGESLDLALLDTRVSALITAFAAAF